MVTSGYMWLQGDTLPQRLGMVTRCDEHTHYGRMHLFHTTNAITESRYRSKSSDYLGFGLNYVKYPYDAK